MWQPSKCFSCKNNNWLKAQLLHWSPLRCLHWSHTFHGPLSAKTEFSWDIKASLLMGNKELHWQEDLALGLSIHLADLSLNSLTLKHFYQSSLPSFLCSFTSGPALSNCITVWQHSQLPAGPSPSSLPAKIIAHLYYFYVPFSEHPN